MISQDYYMKSKLLVRPDFGERYSDVVIRNTVCREHPIHMHDCMEIVFVFRGALECNVSFERYVLREGDFIVVNSYDLHQLKAITEEAVISCIHISQERFHPAEGFIIWWEDILKHNRENFAKQVENIRQLIRQYERFDVEKSVNNTIERILQLFRKAFRLENFQLVGEHDKVQGSEMDIKRAGEIYMYLYRHCDEKLSLEVMAAKFAMNKYYLSHFIKKMVGNGFQKSLNIIRCDRAEIALLDGEKPISEIREDFSFSSNQYFNEMFKSVFGMIPNMYRKAHKQETVVYREFSETPVKDISSLMEGKLRAGAEEKLVEIRLGNGAGSMTIIESAGDEDAVTRYDLGEKGKIRIDLRSDECIIVIRKQ